MPLNQDEWNSMHQIFCTVLDQYQPNYAVLSRSVISIEERVESVISQHGLEHVRSPDHVHFPEGAF